MSDTSTGSTVPRRQLGRHLRDARGRARLTVRAAAEALEWSEAKIWRIETGQTSMRSLDVEAMCRAYDVSAEWTDALKGLARETKGKGWWHAYGDVVPSWFDLYIGLEAEAAGLSCYESELVPGLLQTSDYARTIITTYNPDLGLAEIDRRVNLRMARQALVTRVTARPTLTVVLNESILHRPIGGRRVMGDQCRRLAELTELPNLSVHIIPFSLGIHHGVMSGPFTILRFPENGSGREAEPPLVYVESITGALYLDKPHEIALYDKTFRRILQVVDDQNSATSRALLRAAIKELDR